MKFVVLTHLVVVGLMSLVAFAAYGFDKRRARGNGHRVREKTLHGMALLGGWPGALLGQRTFRHKTHKRSFQIVFWCCVGGHLAAVALTVYLVARFQ